MVALARLILGDPTLKKNQGMFTFVPQVIVPLYVVVYSCPHSKTRGEAIGLLLETRREGLWDAVMAVKIAQWVMGFEEEGGLDCEGYVREEGRMVKLTLRYDLMGRTANVKGLMPVKGKAELREIEADLTW